MFETRYYYDKRIYEKFGSLTEVHGKATSKVFTVKSTTPIFGKVTWDVRIPIDTSHLFTDRQAAVFFLREQLKEQLSRVEREIVEVKKFLGGI